MPRYSLPKDSIVPSTVDGVSVNLTKKSALDTFNPKALGLGDIKNASTPKAAIAGIFDLQGFTYFCGRQIEPNITVPIFLSEYLHWLFATIRKVSTSREFGDNVLLWYHLPFYTKFMGDGILVLWDIAGTTPRNQHNHIISCMNIVDEYESEFLPRIRKKVSYVPPKLRCGLAQGSVLSVGNGDDYVGSCINLAARLQKLPGADISFARTGFDPETEWKNSKNLKNWILLKTSVRGIGEEELVYIRKSAYNKLSEEEKACYTTP